MLSLVGFQKSYLKSFVLREHMFLFSLSWNMFKNLDIVHEIWILLFISLWIGFQWIWKIWEFRMCFKEYLLPNGWVRTFNINLKMFLLSNTPTFTLIVLVSQITNVKEWKCWYSCFSQLHQGSFHCCHWCGIFTYHGDATNQIFCKGAFSWHLKHSHLEK